MNTCILDLRLEYKLNPDSQRGIKPTSLSQSVHMPDLPHPTVCHVSNVFCLSEQIEYWRTKKPNPKTHTNTSNVSHMFHFLGPRCEVNIDECVSNPCQNSGRCIDAPNRYHCMCPDGFIGLHCETNIDECTSAPCLHGRYRIFLHHLKQKLCKLWRNDMKLFLITLLASTPSGDICHMCKELMWCTHRLSHWSLNYSH